jgi:hypothetical protein
VSGANEAVTVGGGTMSGCTTSYSQPAWTGKCCERPCWHAGGVGVSYGTGGTDNGHCCNCGARGSRTWHEAHERVRGHGPYATFSVKVYADEENP